MTIPKFSNSSPRHLGGINHYTANGHFDEAEGAATIVSNAVTAVSILNAGSGYQAAATVSGVNQVNSAVTVDSTGSGTIMVSAEGIKTAAITYSATASTFIANINSALNTALGTSAIVASGGSLSALVFTSSGTNYAGRPIGPITVTILAGSTGFTINGIGTIGVASVCPITTAGVTAITADATIAFSGGGGSSAAATAVLGGGIVVSVPVLVAGTGYTTSPNVTFTGGGGSGASAVGLLGPNGSITAIKITSQGSGYTSAPAANIDPAPAGGTNAITGASVMAMSVSSVTVGTAGSGYTSAPLVTFGHPLIAVHPIDASVIAGLNANLVGPRASAEVIQITSPTLGESKSGANFAVPNAPRGNIILTRSGGTYTTNLRYSLDYVGS
jgi:hypothetical protein